MLGDKGYHFLLNNCEDFATFCKLGISHGSRQAQWFKKEMITQLQETLGKFAGKTTSMISMASECRILKGTWASDALEGLTKRMPRLENCLLLITNGMILICDIRDMIIEREKGRTRCALMEDILGKVFGTLIEKGLVISASMLSETLISTVLGPTGFPFSMVIGFIAKSVISVPSKAVAVYAVQKVARCITSQIFDDKRADIQDLQSGDHIVIYGNTFHPRCHAIVLDVDLISDTIRIVRKLWKQGIVEESIPFPSSAVYKLIYKPNISYSPAVVVSRALDRKYHKPYNIFADNCKHFAIWCKTGFSDNSAHLKGCCLNTDDFLFHTYICNEQIIGAFCMACDTEWLVTEFTSGHSLGKKSMSLFGLNAMEIRKNTAQSSIDDVVGSKHQNVTLVESLTSLKRGDHIAWRVKNAWQHAIIASIQKDSLDVLNYRQVGSTFSVVGERLENLNISGDNMFFIAYPDDAAENNVELVMARAEAMGGNTVRKLPFRTTEGYAVFCKTGTDQTLRFQLPCTAI